MVYFGVDQRTLQSHDSYSTQKTLKTKYSKNETLLKGDKIGHFSKAIVRQNRQN